MSDRGRGYLQLFTTIFLFSTYEVVSRFAAASANPFQLNFMRFLIGGGILFLILALRRDTAIDKFMLARTAALGVLIVGVAMNLMQVGLSLPDAKASRIALLFSTNPLFVALFSVLIGGERPGPRLAAGLGIAATGLGVFFLPDLRGGLDFNSGDLFALASAVAFGLYTYLARGVGVAVGSLKLNAYAFVIGAAAMAPVLLVLDIPVFAVRPADLPAVLYLAVFVTGLAYLLYFKGLAVIGAGRGSMVFFVKPVLAAVLAFLVLGERLSVEAAAGGLLIVLGVAVSSFRTR